MSTSTLGTLESHGFLPFSDADFHMWLTATDLPDGRPPMIWKSAVKGMAVEIHVCSGDVGEVGFFVVLACDESTWVLHVDEGDDMQREAETAAIALKARIEMGEDPGTAAELLWFKLE